MDLRLTPPEEAFRRGLLEWIASVRPPDGLRDYGPTPDVDDIGAAKAWQRILYEAGWAGLSWPREHGGRGASVVEQAIFAEEMARAHLPRQLNVVGLELAGPLIIEFGTDEQRARFLQSILRGDDVWCQLFSEPRAGSDLAGLATRATPREGGWLARGQKVWSSGAQYADFGLLLARTDSEAPRHEGISCFLLPMRRPGVEVRPIRQMDGRAKFNEVFLDDVPVGPEDLLGRPGDGWRIAVSTLGRERLTLGAQAVALFEALAALRADAEAAGAASPRFRRAWIGLWGRVRLLRETWLRMLSECESLSDPRMSVLKIVGSELERDVARAASTLLGPAALAGEGALSRWAARYLASPGGTLAGGTSEIQRNIVAERVLGLPR